MPDKAADATPASRDVIAALLDPGSFTSWDAPRPPRADADYEASLDRAEARSGESESIITGTGLLDGRPVAVVAGEFGFLAGSVGAAAADRFIAAVRRATADGLPVLAAPCSGGTRMQEGTPAFLRMVPVAAAVADHRAAGLPFLVWLRDPTTGGVMATWGSLGQVTAAAPGALAGFLGPRVFEAMTGEPFPPGVQTAENLARVGVVDSVVPLAQLRDWAATALRVLAPAGDGSRDPEAAAVHGPFADAADVPLPDAWDCVLATRSAARPGLAEFAAAAATDVTWLSGTGTGERDDGVRVALARVGGTRCVMVGQDRSAGGSFGPAGLRTARRGYSLAAEAGLPVLNVVDTEGAEVSAGAEEGAMAGEIARTLAALAQLRVPVVSLLLGSGCGGGALAMLPGDVVLAASDAWVTPLPPEGASAILHRTVDRAPELARAQRITAVELARAGVVDGLVGAPGDDGPVEFVARAARAAGSALARAGVSPARVSRFAVAGA